ncbi:MULTISPECIES: glycosyltransferase family 39 protein [Chitinophaga]|uniref:ArnT family glycosyltransferase n=1 Tax=Chitinophaga TaxID=79328 RepID=UPI001CEC2C15|nr:MULTISPECIES: glycosyltransferase family 39 protein [Chitinophaga]
MSHSLPTTPAQQEKQVSMLIIGLLIFMNFSGLNITILEPDGALYASIAKHMVQHNDYWNLFADGGDWLDKPHFPFWMAALSFKLFGFTTAAYKLPAILFLMMGAWYTYLLGRRLYNERVGLWATAILLTAEHIVISNNDVRAEPYLTGLIIAAVYHFYRSERLNIHVVIGSLFTACAVMTKGPFAVIPIGAAVAGQLVFTGQWKQLLQLRWLIAILLTGIFILPELYAVYQQFDLHPEKVVYGKTGVSGLRFFFWDSQFGRFMNTGPVKGAGDPSFFFHTVLWAFLPWSILLYAAVITFFRKRKQAVEFYCITGSLVTFLLFSLSRFQLPHYLNIIFPFFAILTANYILSLQRPKGLKFYRITQHVICGVIGVAIIGLSVLYRPIFNYFAVVTVVAAASLFFLLPRRATDPWSPAFLRTCIASLILGLFLNLVMYPDMMRYQSGSTAANHANLYWRGIPVTLYKANSYSLEYYLNAPVIRADSAGLRQQVAAGAPVLLYTTPETLGELQKSGYRFEIARVFAHFYISKLDGPFVNHATRNSALQQRLLVFIHPGQPAVAKQ